MIVLTRLKIIYRVVFVLALQVMLYELDVMDGLLQLERILLSDGGGHVIKRVINRGHSRVHQAAGRARGRRSVAPGPARGRHEPTQ